jgi:aarF domain-containing kinase
VQNKLSEKPNFELVLLDHGLYQNLSEGFRYNYARIWMSILQADLVKLKNLTENFDLGEYFAAFACVVTGRSWESVNEGIVKVKYTENEGKLIRENSPKYLREISIVLNRIPREMLLLLKTNDLLRGIETSLGTRYSSSSFIHISKCCVKFISAYECGLMNKKLLSNEKLNLVNYLRFNFLIRLGEFFELGKIYAFQLFLFLFNF